MERIRCGLIVSNGSINWSITARRRIITACFHSFRTVEISKHVVQSVAKVVLPLSFKSSRWLVDNCRHCEINQDRTQPASYFQIPENFDFPLARVSVRQIPIPTFELKLPPASALPFHIFRLCSASVHDASKCLKIILSGQLLMHHLHPIGSRISWMDPQPHPMVIRTNRCTQTKTKQKRAMSHPHTTYIPSPHPRRVG